MTTAGNVFVIALIAGSATGIGALPAFLLSDVTPRIRDATLGLAAGILLSTAFFALLLPATESGSLPAIWVGIVTGSVFFVLTDRLATRLLDTANPEAVIESSAGSKRAILVGGTITLHNVPEGLAIGVAFGTGLETTGLVLAVAIGVQNLSDGFVVALAAIESDLSRARLLTYTTLTGAVPEPIAAVAGFVLVSQVGGIFPVLAAFAAGAIFSITFRELIPASQQNGFTDLTTIMFVLGIVVIFAVESIISVL